MRPGDLVRRDPFHVPGCEWRKSNDRTPYLFVRETDQPYKGLFLGPEGLMEFHYIEVTVLDEKR